MAEVVEKKSILHQLYEKKMTWPRLILKGGVEAILCWNAYHYATFHKTQDWACYATHSKQPNDFGVGDNVTERFTMVIWCSFLLCAFGLLNCFVEMVNKFVSNKNLVVLTGVLDSIAVVAAIAWIVWASIVRLDRNGKICAGATMNVTMGSRPYAYEQGVYLVVVLMLCYTVPPVLLIATSCGCL